MGCGIRDSGFEIRDSRFGIRDAGSGIWELGGERSGCLVRNQVFLHSKLVSRISHPFFGMSFIYTHRNRLAAGLIVVCGVVWLCLLPGGGYVNVFRSVTDGSTEPLDIIYREQPAQGGKPQYLREGGRLYLETARIREGWLADWVSYRVRTTWEADDIARLRREHPELESYWPDPNQRNAGVKWVSITEPDI